MYNGTTSSCHRVDSDLITPETFENFHNTPKKIQDRELMLKGKWPTGGCEYCKNIEEAGGSSDRMFHLKIPNMYPVELDVTPLATQVSPSIVEVYFDNVCNMACVYCWDGFSSKIQQENLKFGRFEKHGVIIDNRLSSNDSKDKLCATFWNWMSVHGSKIKRLNVLGGEPFVQTQFDECLIFLEKHACPDLEFNVISNLKVSETQLDLILARIKRLVDDKHIKRFDLTASIDCFGREQEYVRYGLELEQWKENFCTVVNQDWINLNFNQTLSVLTIKTVPELLKFINPLRKSREIGHYFSTTVMTYSFLHPGVFGGEFFLEDFDAILSAMPENTWQQREAKLYMAGIKQQIMLCCRNNEEIKKLVVFLDEIDRRRKLNWREVFPWIEKELLYVV